jgi:hypothetical protein
MCFGYRAIRAYHLRMSTRDSISADRTAFENALVRGVPEEEDDEEEEEQGEDDEGGDEDEAEGYSE